MYFNKFIKYKNKYNKLLKKIKLQKGGDKPNISILDNFSNTSLDDPTNLIHGFLWIESHAIRNIYLYGAFKKGQDNIIKLVRLLFNNVAGTIKISNFLNQYSCDELYNIMKYSETNIILDKIQSLTEKINIPNLDLNTLNRDINKIQKN